MKREIRDRYQVVLRLFWESVRENKKHVGILLLALLILSLSQSLLIVLSGPFIQILLTSGSASVSVLELLGQKKVLAFPSFFEMQVSRDFLRGLLPVLLVIFGLGRGIASYLYQVKVGYLSLLLCKRYRDRLFVAMMKLSYVRNKEKTPAQWMSILMNDVVYLQNRLVDVVNAYIRDSITMLVCWSVLLFLHWPIALSLLVVGPLVARRVGGLGERISIYAQLFQSKLGLVADAILEIRKRFPFIRAQQGREVEEARFHLMNQAYYQGVRKSILLRASFAPMVELIGFLSFSIWIWILLQGKMFSIQLTDIFVFLVALGAFFKPLRNLGEQMGRFKETMGALEESLSVLLAAPPASLHERRRPKEVDLVFPVSIAMASFRMGGPHGIDLRNIQLEAGATIAIIGKSGAGKSTFLKGLAGLLPPLTWEANVAWEDLVLHTSYVSQDPFLFHDTMIENLRYGLKETPSKNPSLEVSTALGLVQMEAEVANFPQGIHSTMDPLQGTISGGQRQRLVVARAWMQHRSILLLDEATSAIDGDMERKLLQALIRMAKEENKILLAVTHRVDTVQFFDHVWVVENGQLSSQSGNPTSTASL